VDERAIYWVNNNDGTNSMGTKGGAVFRAAKDGTGMTVVARDQTNPCYVAIDGRYLYWDNATGGAIWRVEK
jgi:hypothetical protein